MKKAFIFFLMVIYCAISVFIVGCSENEEEATFIRAYPPNNSTIDSDEVITVSFDNTPVTLNVEVQGQRETSYFWELDGKILTVRGNPAFRSGKEYVIIITWTTGRKILNYTVSIPQSRPEVVVIPDAALIASSPASGSKIVSNQSIAIKFDNNPGDVTVTGGGTVSTSGKTRTISPPAAGFPAGALTITVTWTNGDGSHNLTYNVVVADETAPTVKDSSPEDGAEGVSADLEEITVTFTEPITGDLMLMDGDDDLGWEQSTDGDTIALTRIAGSDLGNETEYTIAGTVKDRAGNEVDVELTFTTEAKE